MPGINFASIGLEPNVISLSLSFHKKGSGLSTTRDTKFLKDVGQIVLDRFVAESKCHGNFLIGLAFSNGVSAIAERDGIRLWPSNSRYQHRAMGAGRLTRLMRYRHFDLLIAWRRVVAGNPPRCLTSRGSMSQTQVERFGVRPAGEWWVLQRGVRTLLYPPYLA